MAAESAGPAGGVNRRFGFNEAAAKWPRKDPGRPGRRSAAARFNEAAAKWPRKGGLAKPPCAKHKSLSMRALPRTPGSHAGAADEAPETADASH
jgi:hypothetical protein